jgi:hypothetical protein
MEDKNLIWKAITVDYNDRFKYNHSPKTVYLLNQNSRIAHNRGLIEVYKRNWELKRHPRNESQIVRIHDNNMELIKRISGLTEELIVRDYQSSKIRNLPCKLAYKNRVREGGIRK